MKANVAYNDFYGTVAADISDSIGQTCNNSLDCFTEYFEINKDKFKIVGLSISGTDKLNISLICIDKEKSTGDKDHIVRMHFDSYEDNKILDILFKSLHIVLHDNSNNKYIDMDYDDEVRYSDFHETKNEE